MNEVEEFEKWAVFKKHPIAKNAEGDYLDSLTAALWDAWGARALVQFCRDAGGLQ